MSSRELNVYLDSAYLGKLTDTSGIWGFTYSPEWLEATNSFAVIPGLKLSTSEQLDGSTSRPVQWFFDNLLPEEQARNLLYKGSRVAEGDVFALLQAVGSESAGALTLLPPGEALGDRSADVIDDSTLSEKIRTLPQVPLNDPQRKKMSLAGAQHKMLVIFGADHKLLEPSGAMPSTHILKPEHSQPEQYYFTCRNEWFTMSLAGMCGLPVPEVHIVYVPEAAYIVKRFDRVGEFPEHTRLHVIDGCQLLGIPHQDKYRASTVDNLFALSERCAAPGLTRLLLFRWAVFNALTGNGDAHLKNLSFEVTKRGVKLMPHYDLLSTAIYADGHNGHLREELSQRMGSATYFGELTRNDVVAFAAALGINSTVATRELDKYLSVIDKCAATLIELVKSDARIGPGKAGELRMLREIKTLAIAEMVKRLQ